MAGAGCGVAGAGRGVAGAGRGEGRAARPPGARRRHRVVVLPQHHGAGVGRVALSTE